MNLTTAKAEFEEMRKILGEFAAIPETDIRAGRAIAFSATRWRRYFRGVALLSLLYDSSMPTQRLEPALWPYTLNYKSTQECTVPPCPTGAFPGIWEVPMVTWKDRKGIACSMVDGCANVPQDAEDLANWMLEQFNRHYKSTRAPFPVFMHAAWFLRSAENFKAYKNFIAHLQSLPHVYIVTLNSAIQWMRNPKPLSTQKPFGECETIEVSPRICVAKTCPLTAPSGKEIRWMTSCVKQCPRSYPWIGNPLGSI